MYSTATQGEVLLSFDDRFTDGWVEAIPMFAEYGAKATFFVDHFDQLTPRQLDDLHRLGRQIGSIADQFIIFQQCIGH